MSSCHTFRPVPGQCGPRGRGPLPAPPFDPQDYWATRKLVSSLFGTLETSKLDRADVVDPSSATEDGKAADAKKTQEELDRVLGVASGALALAESKEDKLSGRQLEAVNSGIDADKVAKIVQNESAISAEVSRATTEEARLQALINAIKTFDAVVADSLPDPSEQYGKKLYLVPSTNPETRNVRDEFICVKIADVWKWEQVGSTAITIEFDNEPTEGSQKVARSGGIWSWVKSLLPRWLTSDYAEPATVASVAKKADQSALAAHIMDSSNPHGVTAGQIGAVPLVEDKNGDKTAVTIGSRKSGEPVGLGSLANGGDTTASGDFSHAEGRRTTASGHFSHAEGNLTTASGNYSHAEGYLSQTKKGDAHAFAWNGDNSKTEDDPYKSHGPGTFNINPIGGLNGFYIGDRKFSETLENKADKTTPYADGNLAALTADGNLRDSGRKESDFAPAVEGGYLPLNVGGTVNGDTTFIGSLYAGPLGDILGVTHDAGYLYKHDSVKWYYGGYDKEDANEIAVKGDVSGLESSKADRPALPVTAGNLASLTADGNLEDSGIDRRDVARMYGDSLVVQPGGTTTRVNASMLGYSNVGSDTIKDRLDAKADKTIPSKWGNLSALAEDGNLIDSYIDMQDLALKNQVNWMADSDSGFSSGHGDGFFFNIENGEQRLAVLKGRVIVDRDGKDAGERSVAMLGDINSATRGKADRASLAPEYSATSAYSVGPFVYYGGNIYQCKTAIADGGEAWNAEHWELRKLDDFFTNSNSLLTGTIDEEIIEKGTAPDAHLEAPTDERLKLILADSSVAYDSAKALPYKLTSVIGDRVIATMTLTAASTDITLPTIAANDTTVKDFILDVTNAYAVEGVATDAGINIPRTDFKLVTRDGESLTDVTTVKAGKSAFLCFTQKAPVVVGGTTYPCWCVIQLPFGDPS